MQVSYETYGWVLSAISPDPATKSYTREITDTTTTVRKDTTDYSLEGSQESLSIDNNKSVDRLEKVKDGAFASGQQVGNSTLKNKTVSTASYNSKHTLNEEGSVSGGQLESKSEVTTDYSFSGKSKSLPIPSPPPLGSYTESEKYFLNTRTTTNKSEENGTYFDFLGFRLAFGTYSEEFDSNSMTSSQSTTTTETWSLHTDDGETHLDGGEVKDRTRNSSSDERKVEGKYWPGGGTEKLVKDDKKTNTFDSKSASGFYNYPIPDGNTLRISSEDTTRTNTDISLGKASGVKNRYFTQTICGIVTCGSISGDTTTDLFENYAPTKKDEARDTQGGGGVFAFGAGLAGKAAIEVLDPSGIIRAAGNALGTLAAVAVSTVVDPAIESANAELGWFDQIVGFFFSDVGAQYDKNKALNRQQNAGNGQLRAGSIGTVLGGTQYGNSGKAAAEIKEFGRDVTRDVAIELGTAGLGGTLGKGDDVNDLRKFQKVRKSKAKATGRVWSNTSSLNSAQSAFDHWKKHRGEFPEFQNAKQYVDAAKKLAKSPPSGTLTKLRKNGDLLLYDPKTNTFLVQRPDGAIRTMFRPIDGIDYWNRQ